MLGEVVPCRVKTEARPYQMCGGWPLATLYESESAPIVPDRLAFQSGRWSIGAGWHDVVSFLPQERART